jgi:hypothetical protein
LLEGKANGDCGNCTDREQSEDVSILGEQTHNTLPVKDNNRHERARVEQNVHQGYIRPRLPIELAKQGLCHDEVPGGADREKFSDSLHHT